MSMLASARAGMKQLTDKPSVGYFFLYPAGSFGFIVVIFLANFPLTQVMVVCFVKAAYLLVMVLERKNHRKGNRYL